MNRANIDLILELRSIKEKRLAKELTSLWSRLNIKKEELNSLINKKDWFLNRLRKSQNNIIDINEVSYLSQHVSQINKEIEKTDKEIKQINLEYEKKLNQLIEATKQRKLIEKLKEKWIADQKYEFLRKEQKFLDEIANNRFIYRNV